MAGVSSTSSIGATQTPVNTSPSGGNDVADPSGATRYDIDDLFKVIQSEPCDEGKMHEIIRQQPEIINMQYEDKMKHLPQKYLEGKKFGYLLTQDVLRYLQLEGQVIQVNEYGKQRPLHVACILGRKKAVELLLQQKNIDINAENGSKETPLAIACRAAQLEIANLLLRDSIQQNREIHVAQPDDVCNTSIHYLACRGVYPEWNKDPPDNTLRDLVQSMLKASDRYTKKAAEDFRRFYIDTVLRLGSDRLLKILIELDDGSKDMKINEDGWTALHLAIALGQTGAAKILLGQKANTQLVTKEPPSWNARDFAVAYWEREIVEEIDKLPSQSQDPLPKDLNALVWPANVIQKSKATGRYDFEELSIEQLIQNSPGIKDRNITIWCHFPANNWHWAKDLCKASMPSESKEFFERLQTIFGSSRNLPPSCDHCFIADRTATKNGESGRQKLRYDTGNFVTVLPVIDIDLLSEYECPRYPDGLHPPRTLDHYSDNDLDQRQLGDLNQSQVFTRYLQNTRHRENISEVEEGDQRTVNGRRTGTSDGSFRISQDHSQQSTSFNESPELEAQRSRSAEPDNTQMDQSSTTEPLRTAKSSKKILVVSQLWIIRTNKLLMTLFPQRKGDTSEDKGGLHRLPQAIKKLLKDSEDARVLHHNIVKTSMEHQSSIMIGGKRLIYLDVFSKEILRLSRKIDECYEQLKFWLGKSDRKFKSLSEEATTCLMNINDVLNEIGIIKQVLDHRSSVWEEMHGMLPRGQRGRRGMKVDSCIWGIGACNPSAVRDSLYYKTDKIERNAEMVQKKANTLMGLLYGQAGTENALKASDQNRYLAIFTVLTAVFSPLSFIMALFALQIESFTPSKWAGWQIITGSVVSVAATICICAIAFFSMYIRLRKDRKAIREAKLLESSMES
ncbi:hypothetical protein F5Y04DRAFT_290476 [Hypomontagnella monticulosa]|nr:hypothetical protein F5Y04DRAFT_290476 [Hypomontagnella monticulosa]